MYRKGLLGPLLKLEDTELSSYLLRMLIIYNFQPNSGFFYQSCFSKISGLISVLNLSMNGRTVHTPTHMCMHIYKTKLLWYYAWILI